MLLSSGARDKQDTRQAESLSYRPVAAGSTRAQLVQIVLLEPVLPFTLCCRYHSVCVCWNDYVYGSGEADIRDEHPIRCPKPECQAKTLDGLQSGAIRRRQVQLDASSLPTTPLSDLLEARVRGDQHKLLRQSPEVVDQTKRREAARPPPPPCTRVPRHSFRSQIVGDFCCC